MSKFSPAPWTYECIKDKELPDRLVIKDADGKAVMELWDADEQDKINYKFAATAPEMLRLLKSAQYIIEEHYDNPPGSWLDEAEKLIAEIEKKS